MISFSSKPNLSKTGLKVILDQIENPIILWDREHNRILEVNRKWEELTLWNLADLVNTNIEKIIHHFNIELYNPRELISIKKRDNSFIECTFQYLVLEEARGIYLIIINPNRRSILKTDDPAVIKNIVNNLLQIEGKKGVEQVADEIISILNEIYDLYAASLFLNIESPDTLTLISFSGPKEFFPNSVEIDELGFSHLVEIWKYEDRALNIFQRKARQQKASFLAQIMIQLQNGKTALLLLSFKNVLFFENDFNFLPLLIAIIQNKLSTVLDAKEKINLAKQEILNGQLLENILTNIKTGIVLTDNEGKIKQTNAFLENLLGYSKWEIAGESIQKLFPGLNSNPERLLGEHTKILSQETFLNKRDGSKFPARVAICPVDDETLPTGERGLVFLIDDETNLKSLQMENAQLNRQAEVGILVSSFAHDVRNVFNSIQLNADALRLILPTNIGLHEKVTAIKDECETANQLMESVLSYSSSFEKNKQLVDIQFLLESLIERWKPRLEKLKIKTMLQSQKNIPQVIGDPRSLEQVFGNLISNARDAMSQKGGMLGIYIDKINMNGNPNWLEIKVSDTGAGIPEEIISKVFDPYYSTRPGGTGLGLAITKKIIEQHAGQLEIQSFPGGTTFFVRLPITKNGEKG